jgi:hypothetical protein
MPTIFGMIRDAFSPKEQGAMIGNAFAAGFPGAVSCALLALAILADRSASCGSSVNVRCAIAATPTHWVCALWTSWKKESQLSGGVMSLKFLTLYAKQLDRTVPVYEALGLKFEKEKHGGGPIHFSHSTADLVIEIYPADEHAVAESIMLGFVVENLATVKNLLLESAVTILKDIDVVNGVTRMIFQDPDGRRLFISSGG